MDSKHQYVSLFGPAIFLQMGLQLVLQMGLQLFLQMGLQLVLQMGLQMSLQMGLLHWFGFMDTTKRMCRRFLNAVLRILKLESHYSIKVYLEGYFKSYLP